MRAWTLIALTALAALALPAGHPAAAERELGPTPSGTTISFALRLRLDRRLLDRDLAAGRAPAASAAALGARYGLPPADVRRVERVLAAHGIHVVGSYPQRTVVDARATVATIGRFFGVRYRDHSAGGTVYHAPTAAPAIPPDLRPYVTGVVGLSTRLVAAPAELPHGTLLPGDSALAYDFAPLRKQGLDGSGETIAILSLSHFPPDVAEARDDVATFRDKFAPNGPDPVDVKIDGGGKESDVSEDDLDLDVVSAVAPGAQIVNYEAPGTASGVVDMFERLVADGGAHIATFSWGACDAGLPSAYRSGVVSALELAVLRGISVFVASGDSGSYDCQRSDFGDHRLSVDFPASSPQAVAVGGTLLTVGTDGSYASEAGWEDPLSNAGGGGGVNRIEPAPSWQAAAHVGAGHRGVPDVSAAASPDSGWVVRDYGHWDNLGGTSAAAPFWAASMLLAEQLASKQGVKKRCFLAPILYRLAAADKAAFHDVSAGGNRYYDAGPGWDYATGLGSPDVAVLARDLVAYLRTHPCGPGA